MTTALLFTLAWVGWSVYDSIVRERNPGDAAYLAGNTYFEDGHFAEALPEYEAALAANPGHLFARRGRARSLMQLGRHEESLAVFDEVIGATPEFAASYANRGILHDRMGDYEAALADYRQALRLDPELADGPRWITRFLRNQAERPPTIADRERYLREQLTKPEAERVLRMPEVDAEQRPYKL
jgi:tetratricopeptide (TPR) repeat protein